MPDVSVFIAESASPKDFYLGRVDGFAAKEVLKLRRVRTTYRVVMTAALLRRAVRLAATRDYSCFHLSCHGNEDGVELTDRTWLDWPELASVLEPLSGAGRMLVMSSCSGGYVGLTKALQKADVRFSYVFGSTAADGVDFVHSCLAWSVLYNGLVEAPRVPAELRLTLDKINALVPGDFVLRRWDGSKYQSYPPFKSRRSVPSAGADAGRGDGRRPAPGAPGTAGGRRPS